PPPSPPLLPYSPTRRSSDLPRPAGPVTPEKKKVLAFLLDIGRIPVKCPVPSCTGKGIRSKNNFCSEHYRTLPKDEQLRLREAQKDRKSTRLNSSHQIISYAV